MTTSITQPLLTPVRMGDLDLRNRIVMAPLTRMRADNADRAPTELHARYYEQRASAGLIIGECTAISPAAYGWADTPGLWSAEQVRGWRGAQERKPYLRAALAHRRLITPGLFRCALPMSASDVDPVQVSKSEFHASVFI
jgi:N-ethylmaleimide reductase